MAVAIEQQRDHHRRIEGRPTLAVEPIRSGERGQITLPHRVQHHPRKIVLGQPLPHIRRHQEHLITIRLDEVLRRDQMVPTGHAPRPAPRRVTRQARSRDGLSVGADLYDRVHRRRAPLPARTRRPVVRRTRLRQDRRPLDLLVPGGRSTRASRRRAAIGPRRPECRQDVPQPRAASGHGAGRGHHPTALRPTRGYWTNCSRLPGTSLSSTPTTPSKLTMAGSKPGCDRCAD